ncbi:uncharacterized protein LOC144547477 isoform X3 [Carex rostrata]
MDHGRLAMEAVRRWLVDISAWNPSEHRFQSLLSLLPPQQQPQVTRFVKLEDRKRALVSRLLQYSLLTHVFRIPFHKIIILHTTQGKPYLMETTLQYLNNFMPYFTPFEWDNIVHAGPSNNMLTEFYRYWCLKEAYVKAIGAGLGFGLNRLEFHHNNWTDIYLCIDGIRSDNWRFFIFELENNHLACVAKGHPKEAIESYQVTLTMDSFDEEEYLHAVEFPEPGFISLVVDQLVIQS